MTEERDYYEILGVPRDADAKTIKEAFRRLALRYHPDRNPAPEAEERFKEIATAYAVLGDPDKRAAYDTHGPAGFAGVPPEDLFAGLDLDSILGNFGFDRGGPGGGIFERFFGPRARGPLRGPDLRVDLEVPLERVALGGEERVRITHPRACPDCGGSGAAAGSQGRRCDPCSGSGQRKELEQKGNVRLQRITTCPVCNGRGRRIDEPCLRCGGSGQTADAETIRVRIPVGIGEGTALRIPGKGLQAPDPGASPGDLHVFVHTAPDPRFIRRGPDLWREEFIDPADAVLGTTVQVPLLVGTASVQVPPGTQPDTVLRVRAKGLPRFGSGERGDLYLRIRLRIPEQPSEAERALYERLRGLGQRGSAPPDER